MTKDREIVLMLLLRKRFAYRCRKKLADKMVQEILDGTYKESHPHQWCLDMMDAMHNEAHNAAEAARRILYDKKL